MTRTIRKYAANLLTAAMFVIPTTALADGTNMAPTAAPAVKTTAPAAPAEAAARTLSGKEVYEVTLKGTCWVMIRNAWGTGWVLDREKKLVITNNHVIEGQDVAEVLFPVKQDGKIVREPDYYKANVKPIKARVIDRDFRRDLALLQLDSLPEGVQALKLAATSAEPGDMLRTVGSLPKGSEGLWGTAVGEVRLVSIHRAPQGPIMEIESSMPTNGGNSGGPIVNDRGELVGVHRRARLDATNVSIHIDITEVHSYLKEALPLLAPKTAPQFMARAERQLKTGRVELALADVSEAIKLDGKLVNAYVIRGNLLAGKNDAQTALADFDAALKLKENSTGALIGRGIALRSLNRIDDALADLSKAIEADQSGTEGLRQRGLTYLQANKAQDALADFSLALEKNDKDPTLFALRAKSQQILGQIDAAVADMKSAIKIDPFHGYHNDLGCLFFRAKKYKEAADSFANAIQQLNTNPIYLTNLGDALRMLGAHANAIKLYDNSVGMFEKGVRFDASWTFFGRGVSRRETKDLQGALADLNKAIELNNKLAIFYVERGLTQKAAGAEQAAAADFEMAAKLDPNGLGKQLAAQMNPLIGTWKVNVTLNNGVHLAAVGKFNTDGTYAEVCRITAPDGSTQELVDTGKYLINGDQVTLNMAKNGQIVRQFQRRGNALLVNFPELGGTLTFDLAQ